MGDLAEVHPAAQEVGKATLAERDAAADGTGRERALFCDDLAQSEVPHEGG
jgi:hypothetical protein